MVRALQPLYKNIFSDVNFITAEQEAVKDGRRDVTPTKSTSPSIERSVANNSLDYSTSF